MQTFYKHFPEIDNVKWTLIDSSVPHNVVGIKTDNPRITLCIRFVGNPKFERLIQNAKS